MEDLLLKPDAHGKTPLIDFRATGELAIEGRSIIENAIDYYRPVLEWINNLNEGCPPALTMTIRLEYFNTSSSKMILNIFKMLDNIYLQGKSRVLVNWKYSDSDRDMYEAGYDYQCFVKFPIKMIPSIEN